MAITTDITVTGKTTPTTFMSAICIATRTDITVTGATTIKTVNSEQVRLRAGVVVLTPTLSVFLVWCFPRRMKLITDN
jgi:hypothetical protein